MIARDQLIARLTAWSDTENTDHGADLRMMLGVIADMQHEIAQLRVTGNALAGPAAEMLSGSVLGARRGFPWRR